MSALAQVPARCTGFEPYCRGVQGSIGAVADTFPYAPTRHETR